jgi:hypothetical protein
MTINEIEERQVEELLAPLADIPAVPHREPRVAASRRWVRPVLVTAACLTAIVVAGTAIVTAGRDHEAQPAGTSTTPGETVPARSTVGVWFVRDGKLARVEVEQAVGAGRAPRGALEALLAGPPAGYETAIVPGTKVESFSVADTIATIKLSGRTPVDRGLQQIVATLTDFADINWVRFGVEEGLVDGTLASGAVDTAAPIELVRAEYNGAKVHFAGTADTFEANVQLRLVQDGRELATTFVTATCGSGCRGSFDGTIDVPSGALQIDAASGAVRGTNGSPVRLEAFTRSANDGSVQDVVGREVTRAP